MEVAPAPPLSHWDLPHTLAWEATRVLEWDTVDPALLIQPASTEEDPVLPHQDLDSTLEPRVLPNLDSILELLVQHSLASTMELLVQHQAQHTQASEVQAQHTQG